MCKTRKDVNYLAVKMYNELPKIWKEMSCKKFKKAIYEWLILNPLYDFQEYFTNVNLL